MNFRIIYKLKENPNQLKFLRSHPKWYIYLNRNELNFKEFAKEFKNDYRNYKINKFSNTLDSIEMLEKLFINNK